MQVQERIINGFRLSPQQKRVWSLQEDSLAYCVQAAILLEGNLKKDILKSALEQVVSRQEILRTHFLKPTGVKTPVQVINEKSSLFWQEIDLSDAVFGGRQSHRDSQAQFNQVESLFREARLISSNFEEGLVLHSSLINLSANKHILLVNLPALCGDSYTIKILVQEISQCYNACVQGIELSSEEIVQYLQFSEWQNELLEDADAELGKKYWKKYNLSTLPKVTLPFENKLLADSSKFHIGSYKFKIDASLLTQLDAIAQKHNSSIANLLLTCWQVLLGRFTEESNLTIGIATNGRKYEELETVIGLLTKYLPLSAKLEESFSFKEILQKINKSVQEVEEWQEYFSWQNLAESQNINPDSVYLPFSFEFQAETAKYSAGNITFSIYQQFACSDRFKVRLSCIQQEDSLVAAFDYDANLFNVEDIKRLAEQFQTLVESAIANPEVSISQLDILTQRDRQQLLYEFNNTQTVFPQDKLIHQLFEVQAQTKPNNIAVVFEQQQLTYAELNSRTNQIAHYLQQQGVKPETIVAICLERSLEAIIAILGILKAGGAYLPLDPSFPTQSLLERLQDAQAQILLTNAIIQQQHPALSPPVILYLDTDEQEITSQSHDNPLSQVAKENLAYTIYTSGSTGKPKGVGIEHQQILNYVYSIQQRLDLPDNASFALVSTLAADLGNTAIFPTLCNGGCLHIISTEHATNGQLFADYCRQHQIDCLKIVPSHLEALLTSPSAQELLPKARLILGGEACSWELIKKVQQLAPECKIFNHYGPTETTVGVLTYQVGQINLNSRTVPLGKALANTQVFVLDSQLQPVPIGLPGELYIGGDCLARGYLNQPELTAERFIPHPFISYPSTVTSQQSPKIYKTGDLVRYQADGTLEFLSRVDNQVKIRGFRIELGEIEAVLCQHPSIQQAVVLLREEQTGDQRLVAYIVPSKDIAATIEDWRNFLRKRLPEYMLPTVFVRLKTLPLTPNGKVDKQALPTPDLLNSKPESSLVAPRDGIEIQLKYIWEKLLQVGPIGVKDNFFDLGGHSLLAVRLVAQIEKHLQRKVALATLLQKPTIEQLAVILRQQPDSKSWSPLVPIQPLGNKKPFFCVHGSGGNVMCFHNLAIHLGTDQPLYGLESPGFYAECEPYHRIEDMASCYVKALQSLQPEGPYLLGGWSMGGLIALEMAVQLQQQGHTVALLALLDTKPPILSNQSQQETEFNDAYLLANKAVEMAKFFGKNISISEATVSQLEPEEQLNYVLDIMKQADFIHLDINLQQIRSYLQVIKSHKKAVMDYVGKVYNGKITLFQADQQRFFEEDDKISKNIVELGSSWSKFISQPLDIETIPGDHYTIMAEPNVQVLANKLKSCLDKI
ncbi:amino acid adenylation domain-containing protein [Microcoleus sp. FACHB-831]|uniref:non-ribosomal peptide synthetase n=1 Tax=Microcoleus sp. FACHB-831 TaxID=2692827 RepID=UPI0016829DE9|nr:non-ribosomal peptide synthetase [Microcoleus sp. FACHB-831]MBD1924294.1 amino acid adenylation domain-containing protein [Microcoleus sp. FACHB-831]